MKKILSCLAISSVAVLSSCTADINSNQVNASSANQVTRAERCTVVNVRPVTVTSNNNGAGSLFGAALGGVAGSAIGGDDTAHVLGAIGGALVGGIAGDEAQKGLSRQGGYEYVVQLESGNLATITQGQDSLLTPGEKCIVLFGAKSRVIPARY